MSRQKTEGRSDHILDTALTHFAKYGFAKTSISDIASASNVATGTIYLYYKSKNDILKACAERFHRVHQEFCETLVSSEKPPQQKLRIYLLNRFESWEKETSSASRSTDLATAMVAIAPEINQAEHALWIKTLRSILEDGESSKRYQFNSLSKELKIFLHCLAGFFPMPGTQQLFTPTKKDFIEAIDWFDRKWRSHETK